MSYSTLMVLACLTGVGGGNFASSMANINLFYPQRLRGGPSGSTPAAATWAYPRCSWSAWRSSPPRVPRTPVGARCLPAADRAGRAGGGPLVGHRARARNEPGALREAARDPHTWVMSLLYIGTFGSFIGFGFAFGQVLQLQFADRFPTPVDAAWLTFLGPLVGSLIRPLGGHLADRLGGAG
ncbi:hypothetical protein NKG94_41125 [Micromonospora sp. M12]